MNFDIKNNLLIKGDNLKVMKKLLPCYEGKVKLIYIDPPYNTGNDGFKYNDKFNHSTWLVFMKNRLEVAHQLLADDGVIFVQIDDNEQAYLKVLMDEIFGRGNFVANIVWHKKNVVQNDAKFFSENHEFITCVVKNKNKFILNPLTRSEELNATYKNPDNDPNGVWVSVKMDAKSGSDNSYYEVTFDNGVVWRPSNGRYPAHSKEKLLNFYKEGKLWFGSDGKNIPRKKVYLSEVKQGITPNTLFFNEEVGSTQKAKEEVKALLNSNIFTTPKPEALLERIIQIATCEGDLVLDFFAGSGTTAAVAHKMGRRWITIEQMDYVETITRVRLQKVLEGEQGGVSKNHKWQGGGGFEYINLTNEGL
jgi:adenine-specific DNA-methyltransferase